jgi:hypothetical protein
MGSLPIADDDHLGVRTPRPKREFIAAKDEVRK